MKIMLINPPNCGKSIPEEKYGITSLKQIFKGEPFNLEVLAGPLTEHEVLIFDLKCESEEAFWLAFDEFKPEVVGFTSLTCEANTVIHMAAKIRARCKAVIVIGGNHATYDPDYFNRAEFDYIVIGLGKRSFLNLINRLAQSQEGDAISGIARVAAGKALKYAPATYSELDLMDDIPPRYDLVAKYRSQYFLEQLGLAMGFVITAYGCTHKCSFCTIPGMTGGKYLTHSTDAVIRDIQTLSDITFIRMVDANTFGNTALAMELCDKIRQANIKKKFFADVRADTIVRHPALMKSWKEAGLYAVVVGFEDVQDARLAAYNKKYQGQMIAQAIEILHDLGIVIVGDFIASPEYDENDFEKLEDFIKEHRIEIPVLSILTPMPGTPLYKKIKKDIIIHDLDYYTFTNAVTATKMPADLFYRTYADLVKRLHEKPHKPN